MALIIFFVKYLLNQPWEEEVYFNLTKLFLKINYTSEQEIEFLSSYPMLVVTTALASVHQPTGLGIAWWQVFVITSLAVHGKVGGDYWAAGPGWQCAWQGWRGTECTVPVIQLLVTVQYMSNEARENTVKNV